MQRGLQAALLSIPGSHRHSSQHVPEPLEMSEDVSVLSKLPSSQKLLEEVSLGYQALTAQGKVNLMHVAE